MSEERKLYAITIKIDGYVWCKNKEAAKKFAPDIMRTEDFFDVEVFEADGTELQGWDGKCLVYHDIPEGGDITLFEVLKPKKTEEPSKPTKEQMDELYDWMSNEWLANHDFEMPPYVFAEAVLAKWGPNGCARYGNVV